MYATSSSSRLLGLMKNANMFLVVPYSPSCGSLLSPADDNDDATTYTQHQQVVHTEQNMSTIVPPRQWMLVELTRTGGWEGRGEMDRGKCRVWGAKNKLRPTYIVIPCRQYEATNNINYCSTHPLHSISISSYLGDSIPGWTEAAAAEHHHHHHSHPTWVLI